MNDNEAFLRRGKFGQVNGANCRDITHDYDAQSSMFPVDEYGRPMHFAHIIATSDPGSRHRAAYYCAQLELATLIATTSRRIWQTFDIPPFVYESFPATETTQ